MGALPSGNLKTAYVQYHKGAIQFAEGAYKAAEGHFQRAYSIAPENYNFAIAYGLSRGINGNTKEGLDILNKAEGFLKKNDPERAQKLAYQHFFQGVVYTHSHQFDKALDLFNQSIEIQEPLNEPELMSIFHNALGFATIMHQGKGSREKSDIPAHRHVHRRDLELSLEHFKYALSYDPYNLTAQKNFRLISDSLNQTLEFVSRVPLEESNSEPAHQTMEDELDEQLNLGGYDEVLFLLDISGSMVMEKVTCRGVFRFDVMKELSLDLLSRIPDSTRLGIGTIGGDCGTTPKLWFKLGEINHYDLKQRLEWLVPDGTTPLLNILLETPDLLSTALSRNPTIFLVSDGENVCRVNGIDICDWAADLKDKGIIINILTFLDANLNNAGAFADYACLAHNTGGKIYYIDNFRCRLEKYGIQLAEACRFTIPPMKKADCWGPAVKDLWAIFDEDLH